MTEQRPWQQTWIDNPDLNFAAVWEVGANQPVRVALLFGETWRPIFWVEFGKDGSIYLGPRHAHPFAVAKGSKIVHGGSGTITIDLDEAEPVAAEAAKGGRVTFHPSGLVNFGDERIWRPPFRQLAAPQALCALLFAHPNNYPALTEFRKRDICLPYPIDESHPLAGSVYIAPKEQATIVPHKTAIKQANLIFETPDFVFQLVLAHGPGGAWQQRSVVFVAQPVGESSGPAGSGKE
jgi:hypothetical protein